MVAAPLHEGGQTGTSMLCRHQQLLPVLPRLTQVDSGSSSAVAQASWADCGEPRAGTPHRFWPASQLLPCCLLCRQ